MSTGAAPGDAVLSDEIHPETRNWLLDGFRHVVASFLLFFRTAARITRHPRQFALDWSRGSFRVFNPLAFFATSAGVTGTLGVIVEHLTHEAGSVSTTDFVVHELEPYLQYFLLGLLCHAFLKPLGARRPWYLTLGISLFAGGGPAALADVLAYGLRLALALGLGEAQAVGASVVDTVAAGSILVANGVFLLVLALGLAGIHRIRLWRIVLALAAAELALSGLRVLLFKFVIPEE
jgi:hypothetical protein